MRWILTIVACAACGDGGSGVNLETFATLPLSTGYVLGFEADGTPLVASFSNAQPILRFDGTA